MPRYLAVSLCEIECPFRVTAGHVSRRKPKVTVDDRCVQNVKPTCEDK
jgi:hypothetical protein